VIPLRSVLNSNGAISGEQFRNRIPVDWVAVERRHDRDARASLEYAPQRLQVGRECARVEIIEPHLRARTNGGGRHVKASKGRERNGAVPDLSHGQRQGDL
jgi:hypothetical protein